MNCHAGVRHHSAIGQLNCSRGPLSGNSVVQAFDNELDKIGTPHYIHTYAGAQHAFFNNDRNEVYHPEAAEDAWGRTLAWLRQYLG